MRLETRIFYRRFTGRKSAARKARPRRSGAGVRALRSGGRGPGRSPGLVKDARVYWRETAELYSLPRGVIESSLEAQVADQIDEKAGQEQRILDMWIQSCQDGLGHDKRFAREIHSTWAPELTKTITKMLGLGHKFSPADEHATRTVATHVGEICRMFTPSDEVDAKTFRAVFRFVKENDPACAAPPQRGLWCDVPTLAEGAGNLSPRP